MLYYTKQEIFNLVGQHLLTQMKQSTEGDACLYRGPDGLKCAIGALIPDELYRPSFECNIAHVVNSACGLWPVEFNDFVDGLQRIHDNMMPNEWRTALLAIVHFDSDLIVGDFAYVIASVPE